MAKLSRGALWVMFPPAGIVASYRAGKRKDTQKLVDAIEASANGQHGAAPVDPERELRVLALRARRKEIDERLKSAGFRSRQDRAAAKLQLLRLVVEQGRSVDDALAVVAELAR